MTTAVLGVVAFVAVFLSSEHNRFDREAVEIAFIIGAFASAATMGVMLFIRMRAGIVSDDEALVRLAEQIEHEPLEL